jgi:hypothetical protein
MYHHILRNIKKSTNYIARQQTFKRRYTTDKQTKQTHEINHKNIYNYGILISFVGLSIYEQTIGSKARTIIKNKNSFSRDEYDGTFTIEDVMELMIVPLLLAWFWPISWSLMIRRIKNDMGIINEKKEITNGKDN